MEPEEIDVAPEYVPGLPRATTPLPVTVTPPGPEIEADNVSVLPEIVARTSGLDVLLVIREVASLVTAWVPSPSCSAPALILVGPV
jgi:hypothetical protein